MYDLDLTKPENWLVLLAGLAFLGVIQYLMSKRAKKANRSLGLNLEEMSVEEIAKAWVKDNLKRGSHQGFWVIGLMLVFMSLGLVAILFLPVEIALVLLFLALLSPLYILMFRWKFLNLMELDSRTFEEVKNYVKENRVKLVDEGLKDPEVIAIQEKWPSWILKFNLKTFYSKNFYPRTSPND